jgi:plastocyanin
MQLDRRAQALSIGDNENERRLLNLRRSVIVLANLLVCVACSDNRPGNGVVATARSDGAPGTAASSTHGVVAGKAQTQVGSRSIVLLTPTGTKEFEPPVDKPVMDQVQLSFLPPILIARAGYPVAFHSSDEELHNVNVKDSQTKEQEFNVAIPPDGTFEHTFRNPGFYNVACDIHPAMSAQIIVAATPYVAIAEQDGSFVFADVVPGPYTVIVYAGTKRVERTIDVVSGDNDVQFNNQ